MKQSESRAEPPESNKSVYGPCTSVLCLLPRLSERVWIFKNWILDSNCTYIMHDPRTRSSKGTLNSPSEAFHSDAVDLRAHNFFWWHAKWGGCIKMKSIITAQFGQVWQTHEGGEYTGARLGFKKDIYCACLGWISSLKKENWQNVAKVSHVLTASIRRKLVFKFGDKILFM